MPPTGSEPFSKEEFQRYQRHLLMPEVGAAGQLKIKKARVLCVGAGGLGAPASLYLAAAGVGTIGLVDFDVIDLSNLQRQILYAAADVGRPKLPAAAARLRALNPEIKIETFETRLDSSNALALFKDFDVVIDGADNFPTRYLVNDACVLTGKPNVHGSIFRFEGQVSVFSAAEGPCYRCFFPQPPPPGMVPSCAEAGVFGVLPGVIGTMQALEALKIILNIGRPLIGRLMIFDAMNMEWRTVQFKKNPACPVCGTTPSIESPIDYEAFCAGPKAAAQAGGQALPEISAAELRAKFERGDSFILLDVREPLEYEQARIERSVLIPLGTLPQRCGELDKSREIVVHCKMGGRSAQAVRFLREKGFNAVNLAGGIDGW